MLLYTYPVLVTVGAFLFLREKIATSHLLALALAVGGTILSSQIWQASAGSLWLKGVFYGLGAAVAYSFFILYGEQILNRVEPFTTLVYVQVFSSLILLLYRLPGFLKELPALTLPQLLLGFAVGTVASIIPFWLLLEGIKYIGASRTAIVSTLELPVTFLLAAVFLGERFDFWQGIGAVLIVASVFVVRLRDLRLSDRGKA
ncbi:MAG: DMT family transporter [Firmicutes bacterium]|nr:DMT family transporter [Bacillota bacterium]